MKKVTLVFLFISLFSLTTFSQEVAQIERASLDYIEGFYEGDTMKIRRSLHPDLSKYGYSVDKNTGKYKGHAMTHERAMDFSLDVLKDSRWAAPEDAVKKIEILDVQNQIASVKLTVYWGIDYLLLAKYDGKWMITKVLWQASD